MGFAALYAILRSVCRMRWSEAIPIKKSPGNRRGFFIQRITQPLLGNANCAASWLARCGQRWVMALRRV